MIARFTLAAALALTLLTAAATAAASGVRLTRDDGRAMLTNRNVVVRLDERTGVFTLEANGHLVIQRGYLAQVGLSGENRFTNKLRGSAETITTIDPARNGGERGEVACRFPFRSQDPDLPADLEIRLALGRNDPGPYVTVIWRHRAGQPAYSLELSNLIMKLNPALFDFLAVDEKRHGVMPAPADWDAGMPLNMKEARRLTTGQFRGKAEHKYDYTTQIGNTPAYGWASSRQQIGIWVINPSAEYIAGGPTKTELTGHLDVNAGGVPTLLNTWHGSHYGRAFLSLAADEPWSKVVGPFLLYANAGSPPEELWRDAIARAGRERQAWPYAWVKAPGYVPATERGTVHGRITLADPGKPAAPLTRLMVGLATAPYPSGAVPARILQFPSEIDWQQDGKGYQFWTTAEPNGRFSIPKVRPGTYTLYAYADGVLGQFQRADIVVRSGADTDLGELTWTPVRHGRTVWEIGVPNRSAREFRHGDHYWQWGLYNQYPSEFPKDVNFEIGRSDYRTDWNYCQPPRVAGDRVQPTTWTVAFDMPQAPAAGRATLRLAIAGSRTHNGILVGVNGDRVGTTGAIPDTGVMHRDGIAGIWYEYAVPFDATKLRSGRNTLTLTVPARSWADGVLYDYLRLELAAP